MKAVLFLTVVLLIGLGAPSGRANEPESTAPVGASDTDAEAAITSADESPAEPVEISTRMEGLDTLGVLPKEMITSFGGGTRRINLESSVFRREEPIRYDPTGKRDPFRALIRDEQREGEIETDLLRHENAVLSGVVWAESEYLAMVKDKNGQTFFLREGDPIYQGRVLTVTNSMVTLEVWDFGDYDQITLKING
ncbi:hypothetical protein KKH27_11920 [bacterium]|nr:hypothetical protein [bacterium]MBU1983840.1 hypothetical protein [bacterium]